MAKKKRGKSDTAGRDAAQLAHERAAGFAIHHATGAVVAGPYADGCHGITFYADALGVGGGGGGGLSDSARLDLAQMVVTEETLKAFCQAIQIHLGPEEEEEEEKPKEKDKGKEK